ncbi:hypothetical protein CVT26_004163 [Gymnopilus dilepis]|uniref:ATP-cone domain-containing protein n=1 Tax=Gymnopilus dilepis TaxID=231916 RepID=A0A409WN51_9AGAR|nr:hypothetical protein CVT26_004163 [Gymnopilus dilepis]
METPLLCYPTTSTLRTTSNRVYGHGKPSLSQRCVIHRLTYLRLHAHPPIIPSEDGTLLDFDQQKIAYRITNLLTGEPWGRINAANIDIRHVVNGVVAMQRFPVTTTDRIDRDLAEYCARMGEIHYDYFILAGRISVSRIHKTTPRKFSEFVEMISASPLTRNMFSTEFYDLVADRLPALDTILAPDRDFDLSFAAVHLLVERCLFRIGNVVVETPQFCFMRSVLAANMGGSFDIRAVADTYRRYSLQEASPTCSRGDDV